MPSPATTDTQPFDALIVGGSYAGLSAAMTLGRSLRRVLVIDAGLPANRQTPHAHNFLTRDGMAPAELRSIALAQALAYPTVELVQDTAVLGKADKEGVQITTASGKTYAARRLLLATGVYDIMPDIAGFAECWGRTALHCPYCHGYEVAGKPLAINANGETGFELVKLIQQWSKQLTLFTNGPNTLTKKQMKLVERLGVEVYESPLVALDHADGFMSAVRLEDGTSVPTTAMFGHVAIKQHTDLAEQLGCKMADTGHIATGDMGETNVPNVWAAGDATTVMRQLAAACAAGIKAAADMNQNLIAEDLDLD